MAGLLTELRRRQLKADLTVSLDRLSSATKIYKSYFSFTFSNYIFFNRIHCTQNETKYLFTIVLLNILTISSNP